jgi:hypothetical protein
VLCLALMVSADHSALEDAEEIFDGVGGLAVLADIKALLVIAVFNRFMRGKLAPDFFVQITFISM